MLIMFYFRIFLASRAATMATQSSILEIDVATVGPNLLEAASRETLTSLLLTD